jgi:hypothetical protein
VTETRITYKGDPALVGVLVQMLEEEGVKVRWQPPEERRDVPGMAAPVVVNLVAVGVLTGIKAAVEKFPGQFGSRVDVVGEDDEPPRVGRHRGLKTPAAADGALVLALACRPRVGPDCPARPRFFGGGAGYGGPTKRRHDERRSASYPRGQGVSPAQCFV